MQGDQGDQGDLRRPLMAAAAPTSGGFMDAIIGRRLGSDLFCQSCEAGSQWPEVAVLLILGDLPQSLPTINCARQRLLIQCNVFTSMYLPRSLFTAQHTSILSMASIVRIAPIASWKYHLVVIDVGLFKRRPRWRIMLISSFRCLVSN